MAHQIDLNPATHLTIGTIGAPGQRTFFLQGSRGAQTVSLVIEKEQAVLLAGSLETFLEELERKSPTTARDATEPVSVSYTHLRAHETVLDLVCRLLLEKKNNHLPHTSTQHIA